MASPVKDPALVTVVHSPVIVEELMRTVRGQPDVRLNLALASSLNR
jgi:hypothetical protein